MISRKSRDTRDSFLPPVIRPTNLLNNEPVVERGWCKATTVILIVLFVCGFLSFGISAVIWNFYDDDSGNGKDPNTITTTGTTLTEYTIINFILVFICGFLAFGLSAVAWRFYQKLNNDEQTTSVPTPTTTSTTTTMTQTTSQATVTQRLFRGKRIIAYFTEIETTDITKNQFSKLTHAVFAYIWMDSDGRLQFIDDKAQQRFLSMKNKAKSFNVKVMISIGGHNSGYFSQVIQDSKKKSIFIRSIALFFEKYHLDGVDLFWKWAGTDEKYHYATFLKELKQKLREQEREEGKEYILSIAVPPTGISIWEAGYDLDEILDYVDFINVFSMDYYGPWENEWGTPTGPISPLYTGVSPRKKGVADRKNFNVDWTMKYYICKTKQPNKFNIVIPFFVRLWKNVKDAIETGKEVFRNVELKENKAEGNPWMSRWTVEHEGWKLSPATWDEASKTSYIFDPEARTFLTFETEKSIAAKTDYVNEMNLGGVWIWSVWMMKRSAF